MTCEVLEDDDALVNVVRVHVPSIYGRRGSPLPRRMARLVRPAAAALGRVYADVVASGGHLFISDMFRSAAEQQKAHDDWRTGRKTAFSPPPGGSVHEAARAIDIDAFDTVIGHARVRQILNAHGWTHIVETLTGAECWHYEFREPRWEEVRGRDGYKAMAAGMIAEIGNAVPASRTPVVAAEADRIRRVQQALNDLLGTRLTVDGVLGPKTRAAVRRFQAMHGLQQDGIPGPITRAKLEELLVPA